MYKSKGHIDLADVHIVFPLDETSRNKSNISTRNPQQIGFHGRYKFYHSLENAPGFINVGLRLFNHLRRHI